MFRLISLMSCCTDFNYSMFQVRISAGRRIREMRISSLPLGKCGVLLPHFFTAQFYCMLLCWETGFYPHFYLVIRNDSQNKEIIQKIKRLAFVMKVGCLVCELGIEFLSITMWMQNLKSSQQCCSRFKSSGILILSSGFEDGIGKLLQNKGNY